MAEPRQKSGHFQSQVFYSFDRLLAPKLAQAYDILVPCHIPSGEHSLTLMRKNDKTRVPKAFKIGRRLGICLSLAASRLLRTLPYRFNM
jgi:hypothetical protein